MHVRKLTAYILRVVLRKPFRHASAARSFSDNVIVRAELADGTIGWGEGVPREYVTGESAEGVIQQFVQTPVDEQLQTGATSWQQVIDLCNRFEPAKTVDDPRGCHGNSLRSAVELSLLDAYGQLFGEPVSRMIQQFTPAAKILKERDEVYYSTTIDAEYARHLRRSAVKMRVYGFGQCKIKVGADVAVDAARLKTVRRWMGPRIDLRVDANEAWNSENMVAHARALQPSGISCIEQPVPHSELAALADLRRQVGVPVMLDESLTSVRDAREAARLNACDLFNLRISKCGGLLNALRLAALAVDHGIGYQLGCHPGETGILSAAGRHFATSVGGIRYLEGSYDRHILRQLLTTTDLTFGYGGRASAIRRPGLGTALDLPVAEHYFRDKQEKLVDTC